MTPLVRNILIAAAVVVAVVVFRRRAAAGQPAAASPVDPAAASNVVPVPRLTMEPTATRGTQELPAKIPIAVFNSPLAGLQKPKALFSEAIAGLQGVRRSRGVAVMA